MAHVMAEDAVLRQAASTGRGGDRQQVPHEDLPVEGAGDHQAGGRTHISPDVMVVLGVAKHGRDHYKIWEEGKAPAAPVTS